MANWETVSKNVVNALRDDSVLTSYAKVEFIDSISDYVEKSVTQTVNDGYLILVSTPEGDMVRTESLLNGIKRKFFLLSLAIIVKNEPTSKGRLIGERGKGIFEVQEDVERILEHSNLSGTVDSKAGTNFDSGWTKIPVDSRAITIYTTVYTAVKTE
jgi:hypothetical protein